MLALGLYYAAEGDYLVMVPVQTPVEDTARLVDGRYILHDAGGVTAFLISHADLVPILLEAAEKINVFFPESQVALEVVGDPDEAAVHLVLAIITSLEPDVVVAQRDAFNNSWWFDQLPDVQRRLVIVSEYR